MALSERLQYILDFNTSAGVKSLQQVGATADEELGKVDSGVDRVGANLSKFGAGSLAVAGVVGAALVSMGGKASDLGESINAVEVTFGSAADGIKALGDEAATSVGLSEAAFNGLAVQFAGFAKQVAGTGGDVTGTVDAMTTRVADFASVMNQDVPEAAAIFQSALAGETEGMRRFGIDVSAAAVGAYAVANGISESASSMTEAEKVQARYGLLMQETNQWAGDFANTSGSVANQARIQSARFEDLQARIGQGVLPFMNQLLGAAGSLITVFEGLDESLGGNLGEFAAYGVAGLAVVGTLSSLVGMAIKARDNFKGLGESLSNLSTAGKIAATGLGVATAALAVWQINSAQNNADLQNSARAFAEVGRVAEREIGEVLSAALLLAKLGGQDADEALQGFARTNLEAAKRALETGEAAKLGSETATLLAAAVRDEEAARRQATITTEQYGAAEAGTADATEASTAATEESTAATLHKEQAIKNATAADEEATRAAEAHRAKIDELTSALLGLVGGDIAVRDAQRQAGEAVAAYTAATGDAKVGTDELGAAQDAAAQAVLNAARAAAENEIATRRAAGETVTAATETRIMGERLGDLASLLEPGSALRQQIEGYIGDLGEIPSEVRTAVGADGVEGTIADLERVISAAERVRTNGQVRVSVGSGGGFPLGRARGGTVGDRGPEPYTVVGEQGPELVSLPHGARVHTAQETRRMLGGASVVMHNPVFNNGTDITAFAAAVNMMLGAA